MFGRPVLLRDTAGEDPVVFVGGRHQSLPVRPIGAYRDAAIVFSLLAINDISSPLIHRRISVPTA